MVLNWLIFDERSSSSGQVFALNPRSLITWVNYQSVDSTLVMFVHIKKNKLLNNISIPCLPDNDACHVREKITGAAIVLLYIYITITLRLLADIVSYPKSYFEILAQKGKKLFFDLN